MSAQQQNIPFGFQTGASADFLSGNKIDSAAATQNGGTSGAPFTFQTQRSEPQLFGTNMSNNNGMTFSFNNGSNGVPLLMAGAQQSTGGYQQVGVGYNMNQYAQQQQNSSAMSRNPTDSVNTSVTQPHFLKTPSSSLLKRERSRSMSDPQIYTGVLPSAKKKKTEPEKEETDSNDDEEDIDEDEENASEASNSEFGSMNERESGLLEIEKQNEKLQRQSNINSTGTSPSSNGMGPYVLLNGDMSGTPPHESVAMNMSGSDKKKRRTCSRWTKEENERLIKAFKKHGGKNWNAIAKEVGNKTSDQCNQHWHRVLNPKISKKNWTQEEDNLLLERVRTFGESSWKKISDGIFGRTDLQCRHRYAQIKKKQKREQQTGEPQQQAAPIPIRSVNANGSEFVQSSFNAIPFSGQQQMAIQPNLQQQMQIGGQLQQSTNGSWPGWTGSSGSLPTSYSVAFQPPQDSDFQEEVPSTFNKKLTFKNNNPELMREKFELINKRKMNRENGNNTFKNSSIYLSQTSKTNSTGDMLSAMSTSPPQPSNMSLKFSLQQNPSIRNSFNNQQYTWNTNISNPLNANASINNNASNISSYFNDINGPNPYLSNSSTQPQISINTSVGGSSSNGINPNSFIASARSPLSPNDQSASYQNSFSANMMNSQGANGVGGMDLGFAHSPQSELQQQQQMNAQNAYNSISVSNFDENNNNNGGSQMERERDEDNTTMHEAGGEGSYGLDFNAEKNEDEPMKQSNIFDSE